MDFWKFRLPFGDVEVGFHFLRDSDGTFQSDPAQNTAGNIMLLLRQLPDAVIRLSPMFQCVVSQLLHEGPVFVAPLAAVQVKPDAIGEETVRADLKLFV